MLFYKITKGGQVKNSVSEYAYNARYKSDGWEIIDTVGKSTAASPRPTMPPTPGFVPQSVQDLVLDKRKAESAVAASEAQETAKEVAAEETAQQAEAPKRGRPKKTKA